jgi:hypothetical protein
LEFHHENLFGRRWLSYGLLLRAIIALMMEAASMSETSVNFYQTARPNNPEDSHLHTRRRENLKSHLRLNIRSAGQGSNSGSLEQEARMLDTVQLWPFPNVCQMPGNM